MISRGKLGPRSADIWGGSRPGRASALAGTPRTDVVSLFYHNSCDFWLIILVRVQLSLFVVSQDSQKIFDRLESPLLLRLLFTLNPIAFGTCSVRTLATYVGLPGRTPQRTNLCSSLNDDMPWNIDRLSNLMNNQTDTENGDVVRRWAKARRALRTGNMDLGVRAAAWAGGPRTDPSIPYSDLMLVHSVLVR